MMCRVGQKISVVERRQRTGEAGERVGLDEEIWPGERGPRVGQGRGA